MGSGTDIWGTTVELLLADVSAPEYRGRRWQGMERGMELDEAPNTAAHEVHRVGGDTPPHSTMPVTVPSILTSAVERGGGGTSPTLSLSTQESGVADRVDAGTFTGTFHVWGWNVRGLTDA